MNTLKMLGYRPKLDTDVYVILLNTQGIPKVVAEVLRFLTKKISL